MVIFWHFEFDKLSENFIYFFGISYKDNKMVEIPLKPQLIQLYTFLSTIGKNKI